MAAKETDPKGGAARGKQFAREVKAEMKKVTWPSKKEMVSYTGVVFVAVVLISALIWFYDLVLSGVMNMILS
ncbi:MAG: preprotein translocase subunit SecE [Selenomonadales bacterium]|jgi:preprotein translocase subunit SecE|nr:preprotein translocase subunit SecE [Selenomonadales bacterium]MBQ2246928.1 preprotein translocase subunit SecE [Selenomonadales bacterium]MBQ5587620.1 preprotein translocase subunit SecE [Selenomonadales bacterium]MBQ5745482.1 preprotein translocase subunit SecE [Selenomonadales bacterium]MBQ5832208.1 preprotein translocase subunit SecE [Selenomonadales bacterium]